MSKLKVLVRKQPDRKNFTLYYVDPRTGKEISKSAGTPDHKEAERAAERWEQELGVFRSGRIGWAYFYDRFIKEACGTTASGTRGAYITSLKHFERIIAVDFVTDVTTSHVSEFRQKLLAEGLQIPTVNKQLRHLKAAMRWAARMKMVKEVPYVPLPKSGQRKFMRGRPVTDAEFQLMLANSGAAAGDVAAPSWRRLLELLYWSGLRIEESTVVSWDSPPLQVMIDAKPYPQMLFFEDAHKGGRDEAWPMPPDFAAWLMETPPENRTGLIAPLVGVSGLPITTREEASKAVARIGRAAGIVVNSQGKAKEYASAHDIRRAFGTRWAMKVPPIILQRLMRHKSIDTTMKYYVGLDGSQIGAVLWKHSSGALDYSGFANLVKRMRDMQLRFASLSGTDLELLRQIERQVDEAAIRVCE